MKVLYVSDLDGTLLNREQRLAEDTCKRINQLIKNGVNFTVSTGRGASVNHMLKDIHFKYPIMLLNGTINYDYSRQEYVDELSIAVEKGKEIINAINEFKYKHFKMQIISNGNLEKIEANSWDREKNPLSFNVLHNTEDSEKLENILKQIRGINYFIHKKVYSEGESFCDIVLENVSKASRLKIFKEKYGFDKIIAFGDSENDLPLANVADEFYAVGNAVAAVKEKATGIIGSCYEDGVIDYIEKREKFIEE